MKKFNFSLGTVHKFKNQVLDDLKGQHAAAIAAVARQENVIAELKKGIVTLNLELNEKNKQGITILEATGYKRYLKILDNKVKEENKKLDQLKKTEEEKKEQVVEAKKEVASFDKLKERRLKEYNKEVQKKEELFVEEFVANRSFSGR